MPTPKGTARLEAANDSAQRAEESIDKNVSGMEAKIKRAQGEMNRTATTMVRQMLVANYSKSGVKTRTGKLLSALSEATAYVSIRGKKPKVIIRMPSGEGDYDREDGGGNFYRAAASVNYGSMRNNNERNKKRRSSLKKKAQKEIKRKKGPRDVVAQGQALTGAKKTKSGSVEFGNGTVVTQAFNFWELSKEQQEEIRIKVMEIFNEIVFNSDKD